MALLNGFKETETEQQYRRGEIYYINNAMSVTLSSPRAKWQQSRTRTGTTISTE